MPNLKKSSELHSKVKSSSKKITEENLAAGKTLKKNTTDLQVLQADVASFASSLGLASVGLESGFNDVDFKKTGPINFKKAKQYSEVAQSLQDGSLSKKNSSLLPRKTGQKRKVFLDSEKESPTIKRKEFTGKKEWKTNGFTEFRVGNAGNSQIKLKGGSNRSNQGFSHSFKQKNSNEQQEWRQEKNPLALNYSWVIPQANSLLDLGLWYDTAAKVAESLTVSSSVSGGLGQEPTQKQGRDANLRPNGVGNVAKGDDFVAKMQSDGMQLMEMVAADYEHSRGKDSDIRWVMVARRSGTTADKVAALTVLLQDNPLANLKALDALLGMVTSKGGKRHAAIGIDALKELFLTSLLPDRKLKYLTQQPLTILLGLKDGGKLLLFWYWEDCLKRRYEHFVVALEEATKDNLPFLKDKSLKTVFELLKTKPEQERKLLSALVNKLGDPERKVASNASYCLSCLLSAHPNMKSVVVEEVELFLFRPRVGMRSRYHAVVFLSQLILSSKGDGRKLAKRLVDLYFALFKLIMIGEVKDGDGETMKQKKKRNGLKDKPILSTERIDQDDPDGEVALEIDSRLLSAILTGVNRAFPFVAADDVDTIVEEHTPVLFRLVHSKSFNVGVQALMLLHQLLLKNKAVSDRFYRSLYAVLVSSGLAKSSKLEMFLGLLFKAIKSDIDSKRMGAFAKRLLQVALYQPPQFACACLLLLSEVLKLRPKLWNALLHPEDEDDEIEHFQDFSEDGIVTGTKMPNNKSEVSDDIGKISSEAQETGSDIDGEEELGCALPDLGDEDGTSSDDEEEDLQNEGNELVQMSEKDIINSCSKQLVRPLRKQASNKQTTILNETNSQIRGLWPRKGYYDSRHRNPSFCNADRACWWELTALTSHVHPSVATMARTLLSGASIVYAGDPLRDLALGVFLDRFAEKKPKLRKREGNWHGSSLLAPSRKVAVSSNLPVGSEFLQLSEKSVAPEDVVFHKFYMSKSSSIKGKKRRKVDILDDDVTAVDGEKGSEDELLDGDDSDNEEIDNFLEQNAAVDMTEEALKDQNDSDYDYDKFERAFDLANGEIDLENDGESEGELDLRSLDEQYSDADTVENIGGDDHGSSMDIKKHVKIKKTSKKRGKMSIADGNQSLKTSPYANLDDYAHILGDGVGKEDNKKLTAEGGKTRNQQKRARAAAEGEGTKTQQKRVRRRKH